MAKIKWLTQKQVKTAAAKSELAAVRCCKKHWHQIATATKAEFLTAKDRNETSIGGLHCALCVRCQYTTCKGCLLKQSGTRCCSEWLIACIALGKFEEKESSYRPFKTAAHKLYKKLAVIEKKLAK